MSLDKNSKVCHRRCHDDVNTNFERSSILASKMNSDTSLRSISAPLSLKNETKGKFEALLNSAMIKKHKSEQNKSREHLLNESESEMEDSNNKSYILNKFLKNDASEVFTVKQTREDDEVTFIKPPIPKPRRKKTPKSSPASQKTFEVHSPKIVKINSNASVTSNQTYNIEEIGDVLIHDHNKSSSSSNQSSFVEKGEIETLTDHERQNAKILNENISKIDQVSEIIEMDELQKRDGEEIEPKPLAKPRSRKEKSAVNNEDEITQTSYTYEKIIDIIIHKTDRLQLNSMVVHPVVKVHVVDIETGQYIKKSDKDRSVVFFYENAECDYISPVITHAFNLQEKRTLFPSWEETILLNEDYNYIVEEKRRIIVFFEVLDFVPFSMAKDCTKGWHKIAFAFLKAAGKNDQLNIGTKVKLQLYWYPHHRNAKKEDPRSCQVWSCWKNKNLKKYPSALYVTVGPVISPTKVVEAFRSKTPIQAETSRNQLFDANHKNISGIGGDVANGAESCTNTVEKKDIAWSRYPYEICKLPNKCITKFSTYDEGCFVLKFSNNGLHLGCAVLKNDLYCVVLYSIRSLQEVFSFPCHQGLIYDIVWSSDDVLLLTASADNTVSIFNVKTYSFVQILPHPSFVYSVCISNENKVVASGCYDGTVRIWQKDNEKFNLFQELEGHVGFVTSLCFSKNNVFYSADSLGKIIEWNQDDIRDDWKLSREIQLLDLKNTVINKIILLPKNKRLLVHSRDSMIRIVDLKSTCVIHWFQGALNKRVHISMTLSACGTYVLSGSEDGLVYVWNVKSGHNIATYAPFSRFNNQIRTIIHCVEFHPFDNILAVSHYGDVLPILLLVHDSDCKEALFKMNADEGSECNVDENRKIDMHKFERNEGHKKSVRRGEGDENKINFKSIIRKMDAVIAFQGPNNDASNMKYSNST